MITIDETVYNKMPVEIKKHFIKKQNHSYEEVVALFPNSNGGTGETKIYNDFHNDIRMNASKQVERNSYADEGSAARFFYTAKASASERNMGLYGFENVKGGSYQFRQDGSLDGKIPIKKNIHPTVKPLDLMRYLCRLITPKGGLVLDPFIGSGTTGIAAKQEKMHYIGIEIDEQYLAIAEARIKSAVIEYDIFDFMEE